MLYRTINKIRSRIENIYLFLWFQYNVYNEFLFIYCINNCAHLKQVMLAVFSRLLW
jgi:hypothetical protein